MGASWMDIAKDLTDKFKVNPETQDFDESKGVAARANDLVKQDSPLMQTAATQGTQAAAKRGLTNSSIGVQAAQQAVINSAVPIATADASLYGQNSLANLAAKNAASTSNAQIGAQLGGQAMTLGSQEKQTADTLAVQREKLAQDQAQFGVTSGQTQQQIEAQKEQFAQSLGMTAKDLDLRRDQLTAQQQQFVDNLNLQKSQLAQQASQFGVTSGQTQQQIAQAQQQIDAQKEQFAAQLGMTAKDLDLRRDQLTAQQQQFLDSLNVQKQQLTQQQSQFDASLASNNTNFNKELGQKQSQFDAAQVQQQVLAKADNETRMSIAKLDTESRADIQNSQNIAGAWGTMMSNIQAIQNNANLDDAAKKTLIQNNIASFQSFTNFWKKASGPGLDVSDLLNFGVAASPTPAPAVQPGNGTVRYGPGGVEEAGNGP